MDSAPSPKSQDSREALLRAAKSVFAAKGFEGATVKDLAEAAGVNVSLVSYYFGGKEGLYRTCLENFGRGRLESAQRVLKTPTSAEDFVVRLRLFVEEFIDCHLTEPEIGAILHRECWMDNDLTRDIFETTFLKHFETLVGFIRAAQAAGIVSRETDPLAASGLFFGGIIHVIRSQPILKAAWGITLQDPAFREGIVSQAIRSLSQGILATQGGPAK